MGNLFAHHPKPATGRYSCFHLGNAVGILPAFSAFTGGVDMKRRPEMRALR